MRLTKKCYGCKESFRTTELIEYTGPRAKNPQSYCPTCLVERQARDMFSDKVCSIFGIKAPGPRIWTERKRLINTYGYTDDTIINCLDYIYNVKNYRTLAESLCLVKPSMVDEMMAYKRNEDNEGAKFANAVLGTQIIEHRAPTREHKREQRKGVNIDDYI